MAVALSSGEVELESGGAAVMVGAKAEVIGTPRRIDIGDNSKVRV